MSLVQRGVLGQICRTGGSAKHDMTWYSGLSLAFRWVVANGTILALSI